MPIINPVTIVNSDTSPVNVTIVNVSELVNAQTGTTYTVLSTDWGKLVTFSNGSAIAVTLPEAGSTGFASGWNANFVNLGVGTVTITPTTSTINGAATLTLTTGQGVTITSDGTNYIANVGMGGSALNPTELGYLDGVTPGTATASKALVIGASKEIATITSATITTLTSTTANVPTVNATNVDAGASGTAGTVDIFPTTAAKGKTQIVAVANTNDDTLTINNAAQAAARTYTIPDAGTNTSFVMGAGAATIAGAKTFSTQSIIPVASVAAAGANQGAANPIATGFTLITGGDTLNGVRLPAAAAGLQCIVKNGAALAVNLYPASGDAINAIIADTPLVLAALTSATLTSLDATTWYTTPLLPS